MRYIFVSDIHGCYTKLLHALNNVNFDKDKDTLVSVGDAFDRGDENIEVLKFLVGLPNKILLWGNHDLRLKSIIEKADYNYADLSNGTIYTLDDFGEDCGELEKMSDNLKNQKTEIGKLLYEYFNSCHFYLEFENLYVTHGWLPSGEKWKNAQYYEWADATWSHTENKVCNAIEFDEWPDKPLLVGHWHAFRIAENIYKTPRNYGIKIEGQTCIDTSLFISPDKKLICIDGCSNLDEGQINTYIYESDVPPLLGGK